MIAVIKQFHWTGIDHQGHWQQCQETANSRDALCNALRQRHITPIKIRCKHYLVFSNSLSKKQLIELLSQLSTLLLANFSLIDALTLLLKEQQHPLLQQTSIMLLQRLKKGESFSQALAPILAKHDRFILSTIQAAEQMGTLATQLAHLCQHCQHLQQTRTQLLSTLYYPVAMLGFAIAVGLVLLLFVLPQFQQIYAGFDQPLPHYTQWLLHIAQWLRDYYGYFSVLLVGSVLGMLCGYRYYDHCRWWLQRQLLRLPIVGRLIRTANLGRWSHVLGHALRAGIPLIQALALANRTLHNQTLYQALQPLSHLLKTGNSLSQSIKHISEFSPRQIQLLSLGDQSGQLEQACQQISNHCHQQLEQQLSHLSKWLEPVIIAVIALMVGSCIMAMYLPIFNIGAII